MSKYLRSKGKAIEGNSRKTKKMQCIKFCIFNNRMRVSIFIFFKSKVFNEIFLCFGGFGWFFFSYLMNQMFFLWKPSPYHYLPVWSHNVMLGFLFLVLCCVFCSRNLRFSWGGLKFVLYHCKFDSGSLTRVEKREKIKKSKHGVTKSTI